MRHLGSRVETGFQLRVRTGFRACVCVCVPPLYPPWVRERTTGWGIEALTRTCTTGDEGDG